MSDLLPCPFCGGEAVATLSQEFLDGGSPTAVKVLNLAMDRIRAIPAADARAEALKEAAAVAAKFDSDGMYGAAAIHDAILALAPTPTTR